MARSTKPKTAVTSIKSATGDITDEPLKPATKGAVVVALREVLQKLQSGELEARSWREEYVASAIGLLASGAYKRAAKYAEQAAAHSWIFTGPIYVADLVRGLEAVDSISTD